MPVSTPTLGQLKTALQARGYASDTATAQTEFINSAYRRVMNERRWPFALRFTAPAMNVADIGNQVVNPSFDRDALGWLNNVDDSESLVRIAGAFTGSDGLYAGRASGILATNGAVFPGAGCSAMSVNPGATVTAQLAWRTATIPAASTLFNVFLRFRDINNNIVSDFTLFSVPTPTAGQSGLASGSVLCPAGAATVRLFAEYNIAAGGIGQAWAVDVDEALVTQRVWNIYNPPTNALHVDSVRLYDPIARLTYEPEYLPDQELQKLIAKDSPIYKDLPLFWSRQGPLIQFYPTADQNYTLLIAYWQETPKLVNDTDLALVPTQYQDTILWAAITEIATRQRDWPTVNQAEDRYLMSMKEMRDAYSIEQRQTGREVAHWDYWDQVER